MHTYWMTPHLSYSAMAQLLMFGAIIAIAAIGRLIRSTGRWLRLGYGRGGPVLLQSNGPTAPGPISVSGLKLRLRLIYDRGPRRLRPVALYAVSGHRKADGKIVLDLLHAVCLIQHKPRTFRVDRIVAATDAQGTAIGDLSAWVLATMGIH